MDRKTSDEFVAFESALRETHGAQKRSSKDWFPPEMALLRRKLRTRMRIIDDCALWSDDSLCAVVDVICGTAEVDLALYKRKADNLRLTSHILAWTR